MKKMKRSFALLLALLMMASLLTGCAANTVEMEEHSIPLNDQPGAETDVIDAGETETEESAADAAEPVAEQLAAEGSAPTEEAAPAEESEPVDEPEAVSEAEPVDEPEAISEPEPVDEPEVVSEPEPEAEPTEEPEPEPEAEVTEEPKAEPTEAPAAEEPEPTDEPEPIEEPEADEDEIMSIGMDAPAAIDMDDEAEATATPVPNVTYVTMDCNGGNIEGVTQFPADVLDGKLVKGFEGFNDRIKRDGYRFDGWYTAAEGGTKCTEGMDVNGATTYYAHWIGLVTFDATPGNFTGSPEADNNYTVTLDLGEGNIVKLPDEDPVYDISKDKEEQSVTFDGWYTGKSVVTTEQNDGYKTWSINPSGNKVEAGTKVEPGTVLYAGYKGKDETKVQMVTFYLDWNGIDGRWGHCLTVSREYSADDQGYKLTAEDLLVRYLNWNGEDLGDIADQNALDDYWNKNTFDGYTFKGWSTTEKGEVNVKAGETVVKDGDSIYAVWEKDGSSSKTFDRTDPEAGPVTGLRQEGVTGSHNSGTMTWSTHAKKGNSIKVSVVSMSPARATYKSLIWTVSDGKQTIEVKLDAGSETATATLGKVDLTAQGKDLIVTYNSEDTNLGEFATAAGVSGTATSLTVNVQAVNADDTVINNTGIASTVIFSHNFDKGTVTHPAEKCEDKTVTEYKCADCDATYTTAKVKNHVFSNQVIDKQPTCTEKGHYKYYCSNCNAEGGEGSVPALGHDFKETSNVPVSCNKNEVTKTCQRKGCSTTEVTLVPANNPSLHKWEEYDRYDLTCKLDRVYYRCQVCGKTKYVDEAASNPHQYAVESRMPNDCLHSTYTFKCVYGCGATKVELKKEVNSSLHKYKLVSTTPVDCGHSNYTYKCTTPGCTAQKVEMKKTVNIGLTHSWGAWKETRKATEYVGGIKERTCSVCGTKQTQSTATLTPKPMPEATEKPATFSAKQTQTVSAVASAAVAKKLATPSGIKAAASGANVKISWSKVSGAAKYRVFYKTGNGSWIKLADTTSTSYTWKSAKAGTKYSFTVRCLSADSKTYTSDYNTKGVSFTTAAKKLATPAKIKAAASGTNVKISWGKVSGAAKYRVFYKTGSGSWKKLADTTSTSYTWKSAKAGTKYSFTVRCLSADGKTYTSDYDTKGVSFTTAAKKLATPAKIKAAASGTNVKISWGKVSGAAKYRVFYKTGNGSWKKLADTTSTSYTWKSAKAGTKYSFTVRCLSADGKTYTSDYDTKGVSFTTAAAKKLATPKISKVVKVSNGVKISWGKVSGAAKYRVFYKTGNGSWKKLADTTSTSYTWKGAKSGTTYKFTVRCLSADSKTYTSSYNDAGTSFTYKK